MDGQKFDALIKTASQALTRRGLMGLVSGGAVAVALAEIEPAFARRKGKRKGRKKGRKHGQGACAQLNAGCSAKQACCQGFECNGGVCSCPAGTVASGNSCVPPAAGCASDAECGGGQICQGGSCVAAPPPPPECVGDNDCGNDEVCQNGSCVPAPECVLDADCGDNEECQDGACICPAELQGRCVVQCDAQADCPGDCGCRGLFPGNGDRVVCVDEPFLLCDAPSCTNSNQCDGDELCVFTTCDSPAGSGRCFPVCVG
jgi:hypothetical protein